MSTFLSFILFIGYAYAQTTPLQVGFESPSVTLTENAEPLEISLELTQLPSNSVTVEVMVALDTAQIDDFTLSYSDQTITNQNFRLNVEFDNTLTQTITLTPIDDTLVEQTEIFRLEIQETPTLVAPDNRTLTVTIEDNDTAEVNFIPPVSNQLTEDDSPLEIIVGLSQNFGDGFASPLFVNIVPSGIQSATLNQDYTLSVGENGPDETSETFDLPFPAGQDSQTLTLSLIDDIFMEEVEFIELSLLTTNNNKVTLGNNDSLTLEIIDNDQTTLQVRFESPSVTLTENADPLEISLELAPQLPPGHPPVTVEVRVALDTAQIDDFTLSYDGQAITDQIVSLFVQFDIDNPSTQAITLTPIDDILIEQTETFLLEIQETPTLAAPDNRTLTVTIEDNDVQIRFNDSDGQLDIAEDISAVTIEVILSRSIPMISIEINVDSDLALLQTSLDSEYDYWLLDHTLSGNSFFVEVEPDAMSASFRVGILDDQVIESTESFTLRIPPQSVPTGGLELNLIPINELDVRIIDNDSITVILSPETLESRVVEEGQTIPVEVRLSPGHTLSNPDTVEVTLIVGRNLTARTEQTATLNQDYRIDSEIRAYIFGTEEPMSAEEISITERNDETSITLRFTATIVRYAIDIVVLSDSTVEGDEFLQITTAEPAAGVMIRGRQDFRITIRDANSPQWNITGPGEAREGETVYYTVAYETEIDRPISVLISLRSRIERTDVNSVDQDDFTASFADSLVAQAESLSEITVEKESDQDARLGFMTQSSRQFFTFSLTITSDQQFEGPEGYQITLSSPQIGDLSEFANTDTPIPMNRSQITTIIREELDTPALREMSKLLTPLILRSVTPRFFHTVKDRVNQAFTRPYGQAPLVSENSVSFDLSGILPRSSLTQEELATLPPTRWDAWLSGHWTNVQDSQTIAVRGNILNLWSGMNYRPTGSTLIGLLVGYEGSFLDMEAFRGTLEGQGYSAGAYVGLQVSGLTWHMAGSFTTLTYDAQSFDEASEFDAIRFTASTDLSGTWTLAPLIIRPSLSLLGAWEIQEEYRYGDEQQFYVEEQRFIFSRVSLGPEFVIPWSIDNIAHLEPFINIRLDYDAYNDIPQATVPSQREPTVGYVIDDNYAGLDRLSGHIRFGMNGYITKRFKFGFSGQYANLFKESNPEISTSANLSYRWGEDGRLLRLSATDATALKASLEWDF